MSVSVALQDVVIGLLRASSSVTAIVADRIVDGNDDDLLFPNITLGSSDGIPDDADCIVGRQETLQIDCWTREDGKKWPCRRLVDVVKAALHDVDVATTEGAIVVMEVTQWRVFNDPDGITTHGVVEVTATIEE